MAVVIRTTAQISSPHGRLRSPGAPCFLPDGLFSPTPPPSRCPNLQAAEPTRGQSFSGPRCHELKALPVSLSSVQNSGQKKSHAVKSIWISGKSPTWLIWNNLTDGSRAVQVPWGEEWWARGVALFHRRPALHFEAPLSTAQVKTLQSLNETQKHVSTQVVQLDFRFYHCRLHLRPLPDRRHCRGPVLDSRSDIASASRESAKNRHDVLLLILNIKTPQIINGPYLHKISKTFFT